MGVKLTESPWVKMLVAPRTVMRSILDSNPQRQVHFLAMLSGVCWMLDRCFQGNIGKHFPFQSLLLLCVMLGPLVGLLSLYCQGTFLTWTGKWIGGKGAQTEVRAALAWGSVPMIWELGWWFLGFSLFGGVMFNMDAVDQLPVLEQAAYWALLLWGIIWDIWAAVVYVKCVAEAHQFSAWRACGAMLLSVPLALAAWGLPTLILIGFFYLLAGS
jgi:hypothetical protein